MAILIVIIIAFLIVLYVYTYIKYKKRRNKGVSAVEEFRKNYVDRDDTEDPDQDDLIKYVTRYNSPIDYIEWQDFVEESVQQAAQESNITKQGKDAVKPKRLLF